MTAAYARFKSRLYWHCWQFCLGRNPEQAARHHAEHLHWQRVYRRLIA